jgi:RNA polymerase sigma-70 factor, ECF subfamily
MSVDGVSGFSASDEARLLATLLSAPTPRERDRAWNEFVARFQRLIASCVRQTLVRYGTRLHSDEIDDHAGEVWVALLDDDLRRLRAFSPDRGAKVSTFIGLIATNVTIDKLRRCRLDVTPIDDCVTNDRALLVKETALSDVEHRQHAAIAHVAMAQLSAVERSFVTEAFCEERDPALMARERGVTKTTIYTRKVKVRDKLRRIVGELAA